MPVENRITGTQSKRDTFLRFIKIIHILFILLVLACSSSHKTSIVKNGDPQSAIIIPDNTFPVVQQAAKELQYHIREASGAELEIIKESQKSNRFAGYIYLGDCQETANVGINTKKLPPAGFVLKKIKNDLFLAGRDNNGKIGSHSECTWHGTLWAVYEFLETQMGVRWIWPGKLGEVIPKTKTIQLASLNKSGTPRFEHTQLIVFGVSREGKFGWTSQEARDKFLQDQDTWLLRHRMAATQPINHGHAFGNYWKRFGKTHPEYFNLLPNGKRAPLPTDKSGRGVTMCLSQPKLWQQLVNDWQNKSPRRACINVCENDSPGMCTCESCRAWDAPDSLFESSNYWGKGILPENPKIFRAENAGLTGSSTPWNGDALADDAPSLSDRYAQFYLAVLKTAQKVDSNAVVAGYAYANYWKAPKQTTLNPNIIISYVPPLWFPYTEKMSRDFRENWDGWKRAGARLMLRPNLTHAGHNMPIFYARRLAADYSYAAKNCMIGSKFDSLLGSWGVQGPTLYVLGRMQEYPEWPVDKMLDEYYSAFGKAKKQVQHYFAWWEEISNAVTWEDIRRYHNEEHGGGHKTYIRITDRLFTPDIMTKGRALLEQAITAAQGDNLAEQRVAYLDKGLQNTELTLATLRAQKRYTRTPNSQTKSTYKKAITDLVTYRATIEMDNVSDMGYLAYREIKGAKWDFSLAEQKNQ